MPNLDFIKSRKKPPISEYKQFIKLRTISLAVLGLLLTGFAFIMFFVYSNIYTAIDQVQSIIILKSKLGIETINFELFDKVKKTIEDKK